MSRFLRGAKCDRLTTQWDRNFPGGFFLFIFTFLPVIMGTTRAVKVFDGDSDNNQPKYERRNFNNHR